MPKAALGRGRNQVKYGRWGFYLTGDGRLAQQTMKLVEQGASCQKARAEGGGPRQALVVEKVSKTKVEIAWPLPVSADTCCLLLKKALGGSWKDRVTPPAGVLGTHKEAATAEQGEVEAEAAGAPSVEAAYGAALEAALFDEPSTARGASSAAAGPVSPRPKSLGAVKESAATAEGRHGIALLAMKLETIATVYESRAARDTFQELPQPYTVKWAAELGRGTYGKVYVATTQPATGLEGDESKRSFAIKMLRDEDAEGGAKYTKRDAVGAAEWEVRRHGALGLHPNLVALVDAGLFWEPKGTPGRKSYSPHIGLVFELYEIDVRQFLKKSQFTQSGMRHVLRSVLEGLGFIHSKGCIHCDLKPANIFMRGGLYNRGCFENDALRPLQQLQRWDAVTPCAHKLTPCAHKLKEFEYQVPSSFEVRGGSPCFDFEQSRLDALPPPVGLRGAALRGPGPGPRYLCLRSCFGSRAVSSTLRLRLSAATARAATSANLISQRMHGKGSQRGGSQAKAKSYPKRDPERQCLRKDKG